MEEYRIFNKLSRNAKLSLRFASKIANQVGDNEVKPTHIFLGTLLNKESLGARALASLGLNAKKTMRAFVDDIAFEFDSRELSKKHEFTLAEASTDILRAAYAVASKYNHVYVGTEHVLMAILDNRDLHVTKTLNKTGINAKVFRDALAGFAVYPAGILSKPNQESGEAGEEMDSTLEEIGVDLVEKASDGVFDPLVGRDEELKQVINILSRRRKNNPIITGDPGVGKTALVEGLAQLLAAGTVPNSLQGMRIISLDISAIMAGSKLRGDLEEKMMDIVDEATSSDDVILFIDEIHNILGSGMSGGGMDIGSILKPALTQDNFRVIGATTSQEYTRYFEEDTALARRFQPVNVGEPSVDETVEILHRIEPILEKHHNVNITEDAVKAAVKLSKRYVTDRFLPDKAIDLLDEAAASKRLDLEDKYKEVADMISNKKKASARKEQAVMHGDMKEAKVWQEKEESLDMQIANLDKKRTRSKNAAKYRVDVEVIQSVISKWTGIPISTIDNQETQLLRNLEDVLGKSVIGQHEAIESVSYAIKRARTGISDEGRPWASLLFLGPTGVGKTQLAQTLAQEIFGDQERLIQVDMSELMEMHSISKLIGSPPGYVGFRDGGQLTEQIRRHPHSIILFDEIEKAHPDVLNILLQIMEYGHLTDGKGRKVDFKNTIVILTSNIGAEEISKDKVLGFGVDSKGERSDDEIESAYTNMKDDLIKELKDTLRPELLNRLDDTIIFRSLTRKNARAIVELLVDEFNERIAERDLKVSLSASALTAIVEEGFSEEYGARNLRRVLQDKVESLIADYIIESSSTSSARGEIKIGYVDSEFKITN